jgi:hypothetical protein
MPDAHQPIIYVSAQNLQVCISGKRRRKEDVGKFLSAGNNKENIFSTK